MGYIILKVGPFCTPTRVPFTRRLPVDLLLSDVIMPQMDGKDLYHRLTRIKPGLKSLFISGHTADILGDDIVLDRGINFLQKPFTMQALAQKLREALK